MKNCLIAFLVIGVSLDSLAQIATADDAKAEATKKDRLRIHGTWRIAALNINGKKAKEEDAKKLLVFNGSDGTWLLISQGKEILKGTSTIDPTKKPKSIDFTSTDGEGKQSKFLGIYELGDKARKLCFAPEMKGRPVEFSSSPESDAVLVNFERKKTE